MRIHVFIGVLLLTLAVYLTVLATWWHPGAPLYVNLLGPLIAMAPAGAFILGAALILKK